MRRLAAIGVLWAALLSAMAINGYPFFYWDTSGYVNPAVFENIRSSYYAIFIKAQFACGLSPLEVAVVQSLIVLILLIALFSIAGISVERGSFCAAPILGVSTLPAHAVFLMPDIFVGLSVVALFGCLELQVDNFSSKALYAFLASLVVFSFGAHSSAPFVLLFLGIVFVLLFRKEAGAQRRLKMVAVLMLGALVLSIVESRVRTKVFGIASPGEAFLAARFAEEGLIEKYLPEICRKDPAIKLCTYPTSEIPRELDRFLWGGRKPSVNIQDIYGTPGEDFSAFKNSRRDLVVVNRTILAEENLGLLRFIPRRIWQAISLHRSLDEMKNVWVASDNNIMPTLERLERRFPGIKNEILRRSAQVNPKRNVAMRRYVALISYFAPVFLLLHLIALWCLRNRNPRIFRFALFSLLAIGCNLIVYATLSSPGATRLYDRLGWLSALVAALWASSELDNSREQNTKSQPSKTS
jgi:hypothetical protein